jgi:hypothetical protein
MAIRQTSNQEPSDPRGTGPITFSGIFSLRRDCLLPRQAPGDVALVGDVEMGGADGLNESFPACDQSDQVADTASIRALPMENLQSGIDHKLTGEIRIPSGKGLLLRLHE